MWIPCTERAAKTTVSKINAMKHDIRAGRKIPVTILSTDLEIQNDLSYLESPWKIPLGALTLLIAIKDSLKSRISLKPYLKTKN